MNKPSPKSGLLKLWVATPNEIAKQMA